MLYRALAAAVAAALLLTACAAPAPPAGDLLHIHGLGYTADGRQLIVPAHHGLQIYADGKWQAPRIPAHDYMGFVTTSGGFYSSGHPARGARNLRDPLGLVKSTDGGRTLQKLAFEGESDFHVMGAGYFSHAVYVFTPEPNSRLVAGYHLTLDDGRTWQRALARGLSGRPFAIAVHPTDPQTVAVAGEGGLFLSRDHGNTFQHLIRGPRVAVHFSPDGSRLLHALNQVHAYELATAQFHDLPSPPLAADEVVTYLAVNPARPGEMAAATSMRNVYLLEVGAAGWRQIARDGKGL